MQVSRGNIFKTKGMLCNPKFANKNNWLFDLSSTYILYPLASLPKDGKTGNAHFHRAEFIHCFSDQVLVLLCLPRSIKRDMLANHHHHVPDYDCMARRGKPDP